MCDLSKFTPFAAIFFAASLLSCRAKIESTSERGTSSPASEGPGSAPDGAGSGSGTGETSGAASTAPKGEAVPVSAAAQTLRRFFKTRSQLVLGIRATDVPDHTSVSLFNDTTNGALFENWMPGAVPAGKGLAINFGEELPGGTRDLLVSIAPKSSVAVGHLALGDNRFRLLLTDESDDSLAVASFTLNRRDFSVFGLALAMPDSRLQQSGGFEGDVQVIEGGSFTNGVTILESGSLVLFNR